MPGRPLFYATAMPLRGAATPVLVESHMGRPTKIEPNPEHPATRGGTDVYAQATVLTLYDPDRAQATKFLGEIRAWAQFLTAMQGEMTMQDAKQGSGLRLLTGTVVSPTLAEQIDQLLAAFPQAKWIQWEPVVARERPRGRPPGVRAGRRGAVPFRPGRGGAVARRGLPHGGAWPPAVHARLRRPAPARERSHGDEPALRRREHADQHRHQGRPSLRHEGRRTSRRSRVPSRRGSACREWPRDRFPRR